MRSRTIIDALARSGVTVRAISDREPEGASVASVRQLYVLPRPLGMCPSWRFLREIRGLAKVSDVVIVTSALMLPSVILARVQIPIVWDTGECETLHYSRLPPTLSNRVKGFVWKMLEHWATLVVDRVVTVSSSEAAYWQIKFPRTRSKLSVIQHRPFLVQPTVSQDLGAIRHLSYNHLSGPVVLFVGHLHAKHNLAAAEWAVDSLARQLPVGCTLVLAGAGTDRLSVPQAVKDRVVCLGEVEEIDAVVAEADLCIAPLTSGAGVKTKVLHYFAYGKRVVGTSLAFEGIEGAPGGYVADLHDFGRVVSELLTNEEDAETRLTRVDVQTAWFEERFGVEQIAHKWEVLLTHLGLTGQKVHTSFDE